MIQNGEFVITGLLGWTTLLLPSHNSVFPDGVKLKLQCDGNRSSVEV